MLYGKGNSPDKWITKNEIVIFTTTFLPSQSATNNSHNNTCTIPALLGGYPLANLKTLHAIAFDSLLSEEALSFLRSIDIDNH